MITLPDFDALLNDNTLALNARGLKIAEAYTGHAVVKTAYNLFRSDVQTRYESYAANTEVLLNQTGLEKALTDFQRNMPQDADAISAGLDTLTAHVNDNEQATKDHSTENGALREIFTVLTVAEGKMPNLTGWSVDATRSTLETLRDSSTTGSIDRVRRGRNSSYARIKDDATRRIANLNADGQAQAHKTLQAFNTYLNGGFVTSAPVTAPATARFKRKAEPQP